MKKHFFMQTGSIIASITLLIGIAAAAEQSQPRDSTSAYHFLTETAQGGLAEVTLGQMATAKSENEAVKNFGRRMVQDHSKANNEIKGLATTAGVPLPTEMSAEAKDLQQRLGSLSGVEFDRTYMEEMVKDHKKDIAAFENQAESGKNAQVKEWAKKTLPTLKEHLDLAQSTAKRVSAKDKDRDASGGMSAAASGSQIHEETGKIAGGR